MLLNLLDVGLLLLIAEKDEKIRCVVQIQKIILSIRSIRALRLGSMRRVIGKIEKVVERVI